MTGALLTLRRSPAVAEKLDAMNWCVYLDPAYALRLRIVHNIREIANDEAKLWITGDRTRGEGGQERGLDAEDGWEQGGADEERPECW
jgi:hypothetical protein